MELRALLVSCQRRSPCHSRQQPDEPGLREANQLKMSMATASCYHLSVGVAIDLKKVVSKPRE